VSSIRRSGIATDIPTMAESGYPGFEAVPWFGLMAPAGTPPAIIERLHRETAKIMAMPDVKKKLHDIGADVIGGAPAELAAVIEREIPQWAKVIKGAGIKAGE
jgi:tripartite-type tricarboxylate transporter receptor subunit TctC